MNYTKFIAEDRRLTILRILLESPAYTVNEYLLRDALDSFGHRTSADQVRGDLAWLQDQGTITISITADVHIATLTKHGQDAAEGRITIPGIKRPGAL